jgi:G3E family GTPase
VALKKELKRTHSPDFLFIEPSEMVVTRELRDVMAMGRRDISYEIGPFITLVNGPDFDSLWQDRSFLMIGQMKDADLVAITRSDLMDSHSINELEQKLKTHTNALLPLSVPCDMGINDVMVSVMGHK